MSEVGRKKLDEDKLIFIPPYINMHIQHEGSEIQKIDYLGLALVDDRYINR